MSTKRVLNRSRAYLGTIPILLGFWLGTFLTGAQAQTITINPAQQGDNAVWQDSTTIVGTTAFIDASAWCGGDCTPHDFCDMVTHAINALPSTGGVIDARGVVTSNGTPISCANNPFPQSSSVPMTVLLPPLTIRVHATWVLPNNTRLIGVGRHSYLLATSTFTAADSNNAMIEMGSPTLCPTSGCTGISIEHIKLDGNQLRVLPDGVGLTGIYNGYAKDGSYVDDVELYKIGAVPNQSASFLTTGLLIDSGATGSGPYSRINFPGASSNPCNSNTCVPTACVQVRAGGWPRLSGAADGI